MDSKKWYASKTIWSNAVAMAAIITQGITGKQIIDPGTQGVLLGVINLALRIFTKKEVVW